MNTDLIMTEISTLGEAKISTPVQKRTDGTEDISFVSDESRVVIEVDSSRISQLLKNSQPLPNFELAGPDGTSFLIQAN